jgi:hypothetical protein
MGIDLSFRFWCQNNSDFEKKAAFIEAIVTRITILEYD